jgi:hypothetical protein
LTIRPLCRSLSRRILSLPFFFCYRKNSHPRSFSQTSGEADIPTGLTFKISIFLKFSEFFKRLTKCKMRRTKQKKRPLNILIQIDRISFIYINFSEHSKTFDQKYLRKASSDRRRCNGKASIIYSLTAISHQISWLV